MAHTLKHSDGRTYTFSDVYPNGQIEWSSSKRLDTGHIVAMGGRTNIGGARETWTKLVEQGFVLEVKQPKCPF